jgi:CP family cyanate transporter-like MFS transporter
VGSALTAINLGQLPASILMLPLAERLLTRPAAYAVTGFLSFLSVTAMMVMHGDWIVFWSGVLGFTGAVTLILVLALPSVLSAPDDVHRISAGMFTISYSCAMALSVFVGWLWDLTRLPIAGFAPIALCGLVIAALASGVRR